MNDFIFDEPIEKMDFVLKYTNLSYNFACSHLEHNILYGLPNLMERLWIWHETSDITYFGFADSVYPMLIHVVAKYDESTGNMYKRV